MFTASTAFGTAGMLFRTGATIGLGAFGAATIIPEAMRYGQMSAVERYQFLGSLGAGIVAGAGGLASSYNAGTVGWVRNRFLSRSPAAPVVEVPYAPQSLYAGAGIDMQTGAMSALPGTGVAYAGAGIDAATGAAIMRGGLGSILTTGNALAPGSAAARLPVSVRPTPQGYTRAYRAVSEAEYQQILRTGQFEVPPGKPGFNPMNGKWFADSVEGAAAHGDALHGPGQFRLIEADVPDNAPSLYRHPNMDGKGPARWLDIGDLAGVTPRPVR